MSSKKTNTLELSHPLWSSDFRHGSAVLDESAQFRFDSEWLLPDGLGGFAIGSISGVPMRRYHGILCASLSPPVCRVMLLNACDELIHIPKGGTCGSDLDVRLTGFQFPHQDPPIENPYLTRFEKTIDSCKWIYEIPTQLGPVLVRKSLFIADRIVGARIEYEIESGIDSDDPIEIEIRPLVSMRDFHELNAPGSISIDSFKTESIIEPSVEGIGITRNGFEPKLSIRGIQVQWESMPSVWGNISYQHDANREQDSAEDLFNPGMFKAKVNRNEIRALSIEATIGSEPTIDWAECSKGKTDRVSKAIECALEQAGDPLDSIIRESILKLVCASDEFIVKRTMGDTESVSVLAGYPWFSDWGRDTMIALPGLMLTTGRFDEAHQTLMTFANAIEHGLIPNRFDDDGGSSHYNTVDASLWFIHACGQWAMTTDQPLDPELIKACDTIINAYINGTINKIGLDESDGLIFAGDEHTQLTWMDALRDGVAFTPRHGKAIEINALWINALVLRTSFDSTRPELQARIDQAYQSMLTIMRHGPSGGLIDCLSPIINTRKTDWVGSNELRPNQIFACSLDGIALPGPVGKSVVRAVGESLLTPIGLRTLDPAHPSYCAHYTGSMQQRDNAYHNGTAWPWLLGGYCEAHMRVNQFDDQSCKQAQGIMLGLVSKMESQSVGQLYEIYDGDSSADPSGDQHREQGCMAQAWSISEALRILVLSSKKLNSMI